MDPMVTKVVDKLFDYAGTFPPAGLSLSDAWNVYRAHLDSPKADLIDRMVVASDDLGQLAGLVSDECVGLELSVLASGIRERGWGDALESAAEAMNAFQDAVDPELVAVTAIEVLVPDAEDLDGRLGDLSAFREIEVFIEVPTKFQNAVLPKLFEVEGVYAKMRTGGADVPSVAELSAFMLACAQAEMPFKLTAGLHHAFSHEGGFGFMNCLVAAACALREDATIEDLSQILLGPRISRDESGLYVRDFEVSLPELEEGRDLLLSIGSCEIDEAYEELVGWSR